MGGSVICGAGARSVRRPALAILSAPARATASTREGVGAHSISGPPEARGRTCVVFTFQGRAYISMVSVLPPLHLGSIFAGDVWDHTAIGQDRAHVMDCWPALALD